MRVPSTRTLKAFQLAARTGSFKLAASELCLTPSAVSYRVKALEEEVGVQLFHRGVREVKLTDAGSVYFGEIESLLRRLDAATRELRSRHGRRSLRLKVAPFFASEFLLPRLGRLAGPQFDADIEIAANGSGTGHPEEADVSIVLGSGPWGGGLHALPLLEQSYVPACAPALVGRHHPRTVSELNGYVLLEHEARKDAWERWAEAAGLEPPRPRKRVVFDTMTEMVHAAERAMGVALVPMPLGVERLRTQSLTRLFGHALQIAESYYLLYRQDASERLEVAAFRDWIIEEARAMKDGTASFPYRAGSAARSIAARGIGPPDR